MAVKAKRIDNKSIMQDLLTVETTQNHTQVPGSGLPQDCPKNDSVQNRSSVSGQKRGGRRAWPKTDYRHWLPRVEIREGRTNYEARFFQSGKMHRLTFQTLSREDAAKQAAATWKDIEYLGWEAAFAKARPPVEKKAGTVGALIQAAQGLSSARAQSLDTYAKAFRRIVAGVCGIADADKFKDAGVHYRKKVDAVRLDRITPALVKLWRNDYLRAVESDPLARNRAVVTTNSLIRNAQALFGRKIIADLRELVTLPEVLPLQGVTLETPPSLRYRSRMDARAILAAAQDDLAASSPEAFKLLLLTLVCGLRRSEADLLTWEAFSFKERTLTLADTPHHRLKSNDSAGIIHLDTETAAVFQGFRAQSPEAVFVLHGPQSAPSGRNRAYRAESTQVKLMDWLRAQGVTEARPLHTMRKEIGSIIATEHGLFAAQRYLRHSTPTITAQIYADIKTPITSGLGSALHKPEVMPVAFVTPEKPAKASKKQKGAAQ